MRRAARHDAGDRRRIDRRHIDDKALGRQIFGGGERQTDPGKGAETDAGNELGRKTHGFTHGK